MTAAHDSQRCSVLKNAQPVRILSAKRTNMDERWVCLGGLSCHFSRIATVSTQNPKCVGVQKESLPSCPRTWTLEHKRNQPKK